MKITFQTTVAVPAIFAAMANAVDCFNCSASLVVGPTLYPVAKQAYSEARQNDVFSDINLFEGDGATAHFETYTGSVYALQDAAENVWTYEGPKNGFLAQNLGPEWGSVEVLLVEGTFGVTRPLVVIPDHASVSFDSSARWAAFNSAFVEYDSLRASLPESVAFDAAKAASEGDHYKAKRILEGASSVKAEWLPKREAHSRPIRKLTRTALLAMCF